MLKWNNRIQAFYFTSTQILLHTQQDVCGLVMIVLVQVDGRSQSLAVMGTNLCARHIYGELRFSVLTIPAVEPQFSRISNSV